MTFRLPHRWLDENPENLLGSSLHVSRVTIVAGALHLQGRVRTVSKGSKGRIVTYPAAPRDIANLVLVWKKGDARSGMIFFRDPGNPWEELHERLTPFL